MSAEDDASPRRVEGLTGAVVRAPFGTGSKSERQAIWLETAQGRYVLRRKEGPTYDDAALDKYVGKRVKCDGFVVGYTLLAERIQLVR
jgi:hypothetical protein